ncbi:hypothetical protein E2I00_013961, partial [Balaenoptera physalus]
IKYRQTTQDVPEEVRNHDFRRELEEREKNKRLSNREHTTSSSSDEDDDDDTVALAELEKINKERAEEQARKEQKQKGEEKRIHTKNILNGNPLLNLTGPSQPQANFKVKR